MSEYHNDPPLQFTCIGTAFRTMIGSAAKHDAFFYCMVQHSTLLREDVDHLLAPHIMTPENYHV